MIQLIKYKLGDPQKALDLDFWLLNHFEDEEEITLEYVKHKLLY